MEQNIYISLQVDCIRWFSRNSLLRCIHMLVFFIGLESLYMSRAKSMMYKRIACDRWVYMYVLPSGKLEHVYMITTMWYDSICL
jgi:hypothetical protein